MTQTQTFRILVADDEPAMLDAYQRSLVELLRTSTAPSHSLEDELFADEASKAPSAAPWHYELVAVSQGEAAIQAVARAREEGKPFAVAFLDVRMPPGIDGVEAAARIRAISGDVNIVIVTAYSDTDLRTIGERVRPAENLFYLTKPFHPLEIQQFAHALAHKWHSERSLRVAHKLLEERADAATLAYLNEADARERAEQTVVAKSSIVSRVGVELRAPLNILVGFSALLAREVQGSTDNREYVEYAHLVHQAAADVTKKLETVLETVRFDRNEVTLEKDRFNVADILDTLSRDFRKKATDTNVKLDIRATGLNRHILADIIRLRQALGHLLSNAFDASPKRGRVLLQAEETDDGVALRIEYAYAELDPVAKSQGSRRLSGHSPGLFIAQRIIELHGGRISATASPEAGTVVSIALGSRDAASAEATRNVA